MKIITQVIEDKLKDIVLSAESVSAQGRAIFKQYWSTGVGDAIGGLANGDAATVSSKLTKAMILSGYGVAEQIMNFFGNAEVIEGDHLESVYKIRIGGGARSEILSNPVEDFGSKLLSFSGDLLWLYEQCVGVLKLYSANYVDVAIGSNASVPSDRIVFGASMSKADMLSAMVLSEQLAKLFTNAAVSNGDYAATIAKWKML